MIPRTIEKSILRFAEIFPAISINGPRQSGKTTLAKKLFPNHPYVSLEDFNTRTRAQTNPQEFLEKYKGGAIFDEIQHVPILFSYLQGIIDSSDKTGRFILTGSSNFLLNQYITQSLAGRIAITTLLPLSINELEHAQIHLNSTSLIFKGGFPRLYEKKMEPHELIPSYIQTYLEKDVRQVVNIEKYKEFELFLKLCAGRVGQLVNLTSLSNEVGVSHVTINKWLGILEMSYVIKLLQPYYVNINKRLTKMPKLYFCDTALACSLLDIESEEQLKSHSAYGSLYENLVITELLKTRFNHSKKPNLYFYRDQAGYEVDCMLEKDSKLHLLEIKATKTFTPSFIKNIVYVKEIYKNSLGYIVYDGPSKEISLETQLLSPMDIYNTFH